MAPNWIQPTPHTAVHGHYTISWPDRGFSGKARHGFFDFVFYVNQKTFQME
ncbi:hypothetical protein HPDFL43_06777 [Hoeflea phototrophica DFL-43]|uniref:Uncharacterized protein n=1 Tax=Hoeflea phototrophica (strain DSM 17068 / NCIMB 14078 / DFL-43) TaxID=411684 RepID=A9DCM4_HOEPD|nr:hypothetical protein HPDFL43_06777 [Hoeflea phototrophica DFL-43]